ncbi:MAG: PfkB family carbohydrate kinase [Anaerolineaceae bacterium]|nr:PfkB family carbohydrate kinase [Anaerolineaceae bacterium]
MRNLTPIEPIDYLVIGHVTQDITPGGMVLGGTAAYSALTAKAIGLRVGVVTACESDLPLDELTGIAISAMDSEFTTTFENISTLNGRIQHIHHRAAELDASLIPETWRSTPIVHFGPVDQEVDTNLVRIFPDSFIGMTPQGYFRGWDKDKKVYFSEWPEASYVLQKVSAAVLSIEDVEQDEKRIEEMMSSIRALVITEGAKGARVYWNGELRRFNPPKEKVIDEVGAGDVFATAFFIRFHSTHDAWEAARFATQLAANSVTRPGLKGIPTPAEVQASLLDIVQRV